MQMATAGLVTAGALERMGTRARHLELVRGVLVPVNPPGYEHGRIAVLISAKLLAFAQRAALGTVQVESGFTLFRDPDTVRGPDVSFVRRERLAAAPRHGFFAGAPDVAVEVRAPEVSLKELFEKADDYVRAGAGLVWVVDAESETVYVCRAGRERSRLGKGDTLEGGEVLPGFALEIRELFEDPFGGGAG
jgi:Uma2 family endonuclease